MKISSFWTVLTPAMVLTTYLADAGVGHGKHLWFFTKLNIILLRTIRIGPVSWFYMFLSIFYFLGCWLKIYIHHIFDYPYVEPYGNSSYTNEEWQDYYIAASLLAIAIISARFIYLVIENRKNSKRRWHVSVDPVANHEWLFLLLCAMAFYAFNDMFAFFVTGVDAKLALPLGLNAPLAFMALIGFAVVTSLFLARNVATRGYLTSTSTVVVLLVCAIASISMASRGAIVMQTVPMLIAASYSQAAGGSKTVGLRPFVLFAGFLLGVLTAVSIYRIDVFSGNSTANTELLGFLAPENALLVVDRWIGAGAIMAAVSEPTQSVGLMMQLLQEDPARGNDAIYQTHSGSRYEFLQGITFLTLPGYFGILGLSGSGFVIFLGAMILTLAGMFYESFLRWPLVDQTICIALISAAIANAVTQLSFPRLLIPLLFQMTALVVTMHHLLGNWFTRRSNRRWPDDTVQHAVHS